MASAVTSLFSSDNAARSTCGGPEVISAHAIGSTIQPGIVMIVPNGVRIRKN